MPPPSVPGASPLLTPGSVPPTPRPTSRAGPSDPVRVSGPRLLSLSEGDIQAIGRFTREFVVMSLVPWMEKCVLDWNESVSKISSSLCKAHNALLYSIHPLEGFHRGSSRLLDAYLAPPLHPLL